MSVEIKCVKLSVSRLLVNICMSKKSFKNTKSIFFKRRIYHFLFNAQGKNRSSPDKSGMKKSTWEKNISYTF